MSLLVSPRGNARMSYESRNSPLFATPQTAGRKITAGFSFLQRISKAANIDVWFPDALKQGIEARLAQGLKLSAEQFPAQWAAVRQFELLHESGNHKIYDLDPANLPRAMMDLSRSMRAGGYRITVATIGCYQETSTGDDLEILDLDLQQRIAQMIHMLYLEEQSDEENAANDARLASGVWDFREDLPHVGMVLGAQDLFARHNDDDEEPSTKKRGDKKDGSGGRQYRLARQFFDILNALPQQHILHDTAIGLQLPELIGENQWNYIASPDETLAAFNRVLGDLFDKFNGISLSRLHQRDDATAEIKASTLHLRGYGHPLRDEDLRFYREASWALHPQ